MSKGVIVRHIGESKYVVSQEFAIEKIQQKLALIEDRITELAVEVPEKKVELVNAQSLVESKTGQIDALIPDLNDGVEGALDEITALQSDAIRLQSDVRKIEISLAELISEDLSLKKRRGQLNAVSESKDIEAWCADYNEELSGDVGLIDVNDEGGQGVIIQPGFDGAAEYSAARDGALFPNLAQSARQIFFNSAVLAGVQKWLPRYRVGTIISIDGDICSVSLDDARSSAQNLPINQESTLADVPIIYMNCNGDVFEEDDRVVVRFTQSGPLVVGFEKEPKQCGLDVYILNYTDFNRRVLRMSPDMKTIKEVIVPGSSRLREFAVTDDKFMIVYERPTTYDNPDSDFENFNDSRVVFLNSGFEFVNNYVDPTFRIRHVSGANSTNFLLENNDFFGSSAEIYDLDGGFVKSVDMTSPDMSGAVYPLHHLPANDEFVVYSGEELNTGFFAVSQTNLINGNRTGYLGGRLDPSPFIFVTKNRIYLLQIAASSVEIYDSQMNYIGAWPFNLSPGGNVTSIVVTKLKGYIFSYDQESDLNGGGTIFSEVNVFDRDGDTFTLSEVVDMKATHGFDLIPKAMPDMKKLLALDA